MTPRPNLKTNLPPKINRLLYELAWAIIDEYYDYKNISDTLVKSVKSKLTIAVQSIIDELP